MSKKCRICGIDKPVSDYYRAAGMADGYRSECRLCNLELRARRYREEPVFRQRDLQRVRRWRLENPERYADLQRRTKASPGYKRTLRASHQKRKYGLTLDDYQTMLAAQAGGCAICGAPPSEGQSLHVDHDHDTGAVRGLLCFTCNAGIGMFDHDIDLLSAAVAYLHR
jgi:Autographiviridae endonuclease VII